MCCCIYYDEQFAYTIEIHFFIFFQAIIIMGEPIHWETHLQILIDLLITNGMPNNNLKEIPVTNIPVIAVNPDLLWMSEASNPR